MARSLAFWFENQKENCEEHYNAELHFNYWLLNSNKINYLDVGVKFDPNHKFESINFYLPFDNEAIEYDDKLGCVVCRNKDLIPAIFNSKVKNTSDGPGNGSYQIDFENGDKLQFFTQIEKQTDDSPGGVIITPQNSSDHKGTELSFPASLFETEVKSGSCYFRFRVILKEREKQQSISRLTYSKGAMLTGHLETTELVDFRVNELRNIPGKIKLNNRSPITSVHFFLIREADSEYKISHQDFSRCRILESDLWDNYLASNNNKKQQISEQMLIYHWKDKAKKDEEDNSVNIDHFSAFAKFTKWQVTKRTLLAIFLSIIALGGIGSYLSNFVWELFNKDVQSQQIELICDKEAAENNAVITCFVKKKIAADEETQATGGK
jgi:hypothetical protein